MRAQQRLLYHGQVTIRGPGRPPVQGFARNLSKTGIGLLTTVAVPCEEHTLLLAQARGPALGVRARVLRCAKVKEGLYDVGAVFVALEP